MAFYIRRKKYDEKVKRCEQIAWRGNPDRNLPLKETLPLDYFPSTEELKKHRVIENFDKYFDFLLFYHTQPLEECIPEEDLPAYRGMREYLDQLFRELCIIIEEEDLKSLNGITYSGFFRLSPEKRTEMIEPVMICFYDCDFYPFLQFMIDNVSPYHKPLDLKKALAEGTLNARDLTMIGILEKAWGEIHGI